MEEKSGTVPGQIGYFRSLTKLPRLMSPETPCPEAKLATTFMTTPASFNINSLHYYSGPRHNAPHLCIPSGHLSQQTGPTPLKSSEHGL